MSELKEYCCMRFSRKSGKIDKSLEGIGAGMLELWALQNTMAKTKDSVVFEKKTGIIVQYLEGTGDFPNACHDMKGKNIEDLCPGILAEINKEE